jgi:hypothetical protein
VKLLSPCPVLTTRDSRLGVALLTLSLALGACAPAAWGQLTTRPSPTAPDAGAPMGMPTAASTPPTHDAREALKILEDRKNTLQDFTAKIDYAVLHPDLGETSGKRGTVDFLNDPNKGPIFTVDFTADTDDLGKVRRAHHQQVIFDGQNVTTKDFLPKEFMRMNVLPPGGKPGDAITLNGPMTLPIGIRVDDVVANFDVTLVSSSADATTLRLLPKTSGKFDFRELQITVDKKLQLPMKLVQTAKNRDVTTITLTDPQVNTGKARMQDPTPPVGEGWRERTPPAPSGPGQTPPAR